MRQSFSFGFASAKVWNKRIYLRLHICIARINLLFVRTWKQCGMTMNWAEKIRQIKMTWKHEIAKIQAHCGAMNESRFSVTNSWIENTITNRHKANSELSIKLTSLFECCCWKSQTKSIFGIFPSETLRMRICKTLNSMKWISKNLKYRKLIAYAH